MKLSIIGMLLAPITNIMKPIVTCTFFLLFAIYTNAQTITGKVYREGTDSVVVGASVYYGGSMYGTITNNKGQFQLIAKSEKIPITVSSIGYYSASFHYQPNQSLIVYLKPKQEELRTIVIRADGMNRKEETWLFIREFLGLSYYARNCTISNIDDVDFFYNKTTRVLTATCDKPIIINNKTLGYTISYYLDRFVKTPKQTYFAGDYNLKENTFINDQEKAKILRNRETAYEGSRMQLIRALWNRTLKASGFSLYSSGYTPLREKDIVVSDSANNKYLRLNDKVRIIYGMNNRTLNTMSCREALSFIDSSGFYNAGLQWAGEMGQQRVGDLLPFDYQPLGELKDKGKMGSSPAVIAKKDKNTPRVDKQLELFKSIVLVKDNPLNNQLVIRKWNQPVYYKIYGTCGNKDLDQRLADFAKVIFKRVTDNSALQITNVTDDKTVNFFIILNGDAKNYKPVLPVDAVSYFASHQQSPGYYSYNENGFTLMVKLIDLKSIGEPASKFPIINYILRQHILNGLGFFNLVSLYRGSIFYNDVINESDPLSKASDINIIRSLYRSDINSGMTEQEIDNVLNK